MNDVGTYKELVLNPSPGKVNSPMTTVGMLGSVSGVTEVGSGTVLIPPSLTFNLR